MPYSLRRATADDIGALRDLFIQTINTINARDYTPEQIKAWTSRAHDDWRWQSRIAEQHFLVVEEDRQIIGFASMTNTGYVDLLYVHVGHQRRKIAKTLLHHLLESGRKLGITEYTVHASITARPFFEKAGFTMVKEHHKDIDGIVLMNFEMRMIVS